MGTNAENRNNRCFIIMPFSTPSGYEEDHFTKVYEQIIKPAVKKANLEPERVDENLLSTDIVAKIFKGLTECDMAICDLSSRNPNVLYELGIRQAYNKPVLLIKDEITDKIFDVGGLTTIEYQSNRLYENVTEAVENISNALTEHVSQNNNVINIIKSRLGETFKSSEIPTGNDMDKDDKIFNLLNSLVDDIELIKKQINSNSFRTYKEDEIENEIKRKQLVTTLGRLRNLELNNIIDKKDYSSVKKLQKLQNMVDRLLVKEYISDNDFKQVMDRLMLIERGIEVY